MVWGNPADERITCVHEELFIRGWDRRLPAVAQTADLLPVVRKWILEGRNDAADSLITTAADNQLRAMGARQRWPVIPHPAFDLRIRYLNGRPSGASYQRKLNLAEGTVTVAPTAAGGREEVFTSRADNVTVIRLTAAKGRKLNVSLALLNLPADYQTLLSPHRKEHGAMFRRMQLDLG